MKLKAEFPKALVEKKKNFSLKPGSRGCLSNSAAHGYFFLFFLILSVGHIYRGIFFFLPEVWEFIVARMETSDIAFSGASN